MMIGMGLNLAAMRAGGAFTSSHLLLLTRSTAGWAQDLSGNLLAFGVDQRRLTNAGLTLTGAATRLHGEAPTNGANISGTSSLLPSDGLFNPRRFDSNEALVGRWGVGFSVTNTVPVYVRVRAKSGTSGRIRITCRDITAATESVLRGEFASPSVELSNAGAISAFVNTLLPSGDREFTFTWTPNSTSAVGNLGVGPDSTTSGEYIDIIGMQATTEFSEWIMGGASTFAQAADAGVLQLATGTYNITVTFENDSTQLFSSVSVTAPGWAVPTNLNRPVLKQIVAVSA